MIEFDIRKLNFYIVFGMRNYLDVVSDIVYVCSFNEEDYIKNNLKLDFKIRAIRKVSLYGISSDNNKMIEPVLFDMTGKRYSNLKDVETDYFIAKLSGL